MIVLTTLPFLCGVVVSLANTFFNSSLQPLTVPLDSPQFAILPARSSHRFLRTPGRTTRHGTSFISANALV